MEDQEASFPISPSLTPPLPDPLTKPEQPPVTEEDAFSLSHLTVECRHRTETILLTLITNDLTIQEPNSKGQTDTKLTKNKPILLQNVAEDDRSIKRQGERECEAGRMTGASLLLSFVAFQEQLTTNSLLIGMMNTCDVISTDILTV